MDGIDLEQLQDALTRTRQALALWVRYIPCVHWQPWLAPSCSQSDTHLSRTVHERCAACHTDDRSWLAHHA